MKHFGFFSHMIKQSKAFFLSLWFIGILLSGYISFQIYRLILIEEEKQFVIETQNTAHIIEEAIDSYVYGLQGTLGVYDAFDGNPTEVQFRKYAKLRNYFSNFSGALGFGFIRYVENSKLENYLLSRSKEIPGLKLKTIDKQLSESFKNHFIIELIEPYSRNAPARGLDIGSEINRRTAATRALETGKPQLTSSIQLVQADKKEPGFLILLPYYKGLVETHTLQERRDTIYGWAYAPILLSEITSQINKKISPSISYEIFETLSKGEKGLMSQNLSLNKTGHFKAERNLHVGGQNWLLKFYSNDLPNEWMQTAIPFLMFLLICGIITVALYSYRKLLFKHAEKVIEATNYSQWNEALINGADYAIISTRPDGIITTFNHAAEKMFGYKASEMVNINTPAIIHDSEEVKAHSQKLSQELGHEIEPGFRTFVIKTERNEIDINEWTCIRKDGSRLPIRLCVSCIRDKEDNVIGYVGMGEDLTKQKDFENLIATQKAQMETSAKMSTLGEMAGGIAHEINNPLAIIAGKSFQIRKLLDSTPIDAEKAKNEITKIEQTAERIAKIVRGLRSFSRNAENDEMIPFSIKSVINDTLELCFEKFKNNNVELHIDVAENIMIQGRPAQISQVIMNLLSNAYDAIQHQSAKWIQIEGQIKNQHVIIKFTDSGPGIPEKVVQKMFNPFYTTKEVGHGTGLGLSISHGIIKEHNGLLAYNKNHQNTQFIIDLPIVN